MKQRFEQRSREMMESESVEDRKSFLRVIRGCLQDKFAVISREGNGHETLLLCYDEIQELLPLFPNDMKYLIQYYWVVAEIFTEQVMRGLQVNVGRPYFEPVFRKIHTLTFSKTLTEASLLTILASQEKSFKRVIRQRINKYFSYAISGLGDRTRVSLIPALVKAIICGDGTISENISKAITLGIRDSSLTHRILRVRSRQYYESLVHRHPLQKRE